MFLNLFLTSISYVNFHKNFFRYKNIRFFNSIELITLLINSVFAGYFFDFMSIDENLIKHESEFNQVSFFYVKKHQIVISNFFLNIKHNLDFNYKYFHRFLPTDSEKFDSYHKKKNMLSLNNIDLIGDVFLSNYDSLSKDYLQLKFCDNSKLNSNYFIDANFPDDKKQLITNIKTLYNYDINPFCADILDIIKLNSKTKIFTNNVCDGSFLFSDLINSAKYKFDLYQFTFSCNIVIYTTFKVLNSICSSFFFGVILDHSDFMYDSIATIFNNTSNNYILDKFTNYFQLFNRHISTILLKNKKFKINKKLKNIKKINFNNNIKTMRFNISKPKFIQVYVFTIINYIYSFYKYFTLPFFFKIKIDNLFDYVFFLNYSITNSSIYDNSLGIKINYKNTFKIENLIFKKFFKKLFKKNENNFFNYSKIYDLKNNNLSLLANSFYTNLMQRNNFLRDYINNYLIKFDSLSSSYDSLASLYSTNKKIKAYHTFFNTVFFKKKIV